MFIRNHPILLVAITVIVLVAGLFVNTYFDNNAQSKRPRGGAVPVVVSQVVPQSFVDQVESIGTALANESVSITAKVTETVTKVNFEDGDYVDAGDILVELTNAEETALLNEAKANVAEATRQFERVENLIAQQLASETQLDVERNRKQTAEARLEGILARLNDRLIRAPFSGKLGFRNVSPGTLLTPNVALTTLDDISSIKLEFSIPESFLATVANGQEVIAASVAYPNRKFKGSVVTIGSRVDPNTRTIALRAELGNEELLLRPGMLLNVTLVQNRQEYLAIPESAVIPVQDKQFAYTVIDGKAERREFRAGRRVPGFVEVIEGFNPGDTVVTEGIIKLRPGSPVELINSEVERVAEKRALSKTSGS